MNQQNTIEKYPKINKTQIASGVQVIIASFAEVEEILPEAKTDDATDYTDDEEEDFT